MWRGMRRFAATCKDKDSQLNRHEARLLMSYVVLVAIRRDIYIVFDQADGKKVMARHDSKSATDTDALDGCDSCIPRVGLQ